MTNTFKSLITDISDGCEYCKRQWPDRICDEHRIERDAYKKAQKIVEDAIEKVKGEKGLCLDRCPQGFEHCEGKDLVLEDLKKELFG